MKPGFLVWFAAIIIIILAISCADNGLQIKQKIKKNLTGMEIAYSDIAGKTLTYTVSAKDIKSIERIEIKGDAGWRVEVGESLRWVIYYDSEGEKIIKREQLFMT